jgi:1-acyl-sn-glycerol-3-phosphate acyltransferase
MINHQNLFKNTKSYTALRAFTRYLHSLYYSEICVVNPENVTGHEPVIFAPNHENALMDALAIILTVHSQPVFMARADIFKKDSIARILNFLKIVPVFRIRDGVDNLANNDESFDIILQALTHGQSVAMMPEGNHGDQHRLRPLKKGIVRFAFSAQEALGKTKPVKIMPVGLEYRSYSNFRSKLLVIYGKPILVSDYWDAYTENPQKAFNLLRERLAFEMSAIMLNADNSVYYNTIIDCKDMYAPRLHKKLKLKDDYYGLFLAEKQITDKLTLLANQYSPLVSNLEPLVTEYSQGLRKANLRNWVFDTKMPEIPELSFELFKYVLFLPFFVVAAGFNAIPYALSWYMSTRIKDTQFRSSFKFAIGFLAFPLYYLLMFAWPIPLMTKLIFLVTMPLLGLLSFDYFVALKKLYGKFRYHSMVKDNDPVIKHLQKLRTEIYKKLDQIFDNN